MDSRHWIRPRMHRLGIWINVNVYLFYADKHQEFHQTSFCSPVALKANLLFDVHLDEWVISQPQLHLSFHTWHPGSWLQSIWANLHWKACLWLACETCLPWHQVLLNPNCQVDEVWHKPLTNVRCNHNFWCAWLRSDARCVIGPDCRVSSEVADVQGHNLGHILGRGPWS